MISQYSLDAVAARVRTPMRHPRTSMITSTACTLSWADAVGGAIVCQSGELYKCGLPAAFNRGEHCDALCAGSWQFELALTAKIPVGAVAAVPAYVRGGDGPRWR